MKTLSIICMLVFLIGTSSFADQIKAEVTSTTPVYQVDADGNQVLDAKGKPIKVGETKTYTIKHYVTLKDINNKDVLIEDKTRTKSGELSALEARRDRIQALLDEANAEILEIQKLP